MEIGKVLESYRRSMGLTQKEMAANILTTSYYSKVERGNHRITAVDLFDILELHGIKVSYFYEKYRESGGISEFDRQQREILQAYNALDIDALNRLKNQVPTLQLTNEEQQILNILTTVLLAVLNNEVGSLAEQDKMKIQNKIFDIENWNEFKLSLFANVMAIYSVEANHTMISNIMMEDLETMEDEKQVIILTILINFILMCIYRNEFHLAHYYIKKIKAVTTDPQTNVFHKLVCEFCWNYLNFQEKKEPIFYGNMQTIIKSFELIDVPLVAGPFKSMLIELENE
ncbi:Rgg family transcriptional regulator [Tuanshanicoccus lijuaniae]|uniref:Rgg family transcriptional regulator n=1 Tax=Aerococcaceae bacterium zg-1292 TaxID=2774330 RepID=UPI001BD8AE30|nr:helix-turn-helix domain-containing protein [Aerococcaceae bacterium zg-A91]MBS4457540.1 helix-turn-helix domain-containing protein [Aerococcaceae bacterium zg-BR33]